MTESASADRSSPGGPGGPRGGSPGGLSDGAALHEFRTPFKVHLCWFDNASGVSCAAAARELREILHRPLQREVEHRPLQDDAVHRPGIEIPVEYGRSLPDLLDALDAGDEPAVGVRLVIAILDAEAAKRQADRSAVRRAVLRWRGEGGGGGEVFLPVIAGGGWQAELRGAPALAPIEIDLAAPGRRWTLGIQACLAAGRALAPSEAARPRVVLSYARSDGAELAGRLAARIHGHTGLDTWYDRSYAPTGEELARQLQRPGEAVVLVVRTDRYSESPACAHELLAAKRSRAPIVTLLATVDGEVSASAYSGNHRTMNWSDGRELEVAARCVQAWLHGHHFRVAALAALALAGLPADSDILPRYPELLDLIGGSRTGRRLVIHPDPPLTDGEATVLRTAYPAVRIATPTTLLGRVLLAQDPEPPLTGTTLAFSLSVAEDLPRIADGRVGSGLTQDHVEDTVHALVLATLRAGARIAYGGDGRRDEGYTRFLVGLHRSYGGLGTRSSAQLIRFLDPDERAGVDLDGVEFEPAELAAPRGTEDYPELRPVLWRLAMREATSARCAGRILLGGRTRPREIPGDGGYRSPWPGLLEEAWRTLRHGAALYIVGGFGGAAGLIAAMLRRGDIPPPLTRAYHAGGPLEVLLGKVNAARAALAAAGVAPEVLLEIAPGRHADIEDLAGLVLARWQRFAAGDRAAWPNGLDVDENLRLLRSTDRTEITYLVLEGLRRIVRKPDGELQLAVYLGDIASVPRIDGYAVTVTPGVPSVGAFAALEPHLERARRGAPAAAPGIALEPVATSDLSGSHVLIAPLALPPIGQAVEAAAIEAMAYEIARKANAVGLESIACPVLGTRFGLSIASSARAIVDGVRRGRGHHPTKLVFCEVDRGRYEQLHTALGPEAVELRAGVVSPVPTRGPVLHVDVEPQPTGAARARVTLYVTDASPAVAPLHEVTLAAERWAELGRPIQRFDETARIGRALWRDLLSSEMQTQLRAEVDRPVMILCDRTASAIPWELLSDDLDGARRPGGVVRRIALSGPFRPPVQQVERARLRVLVVTDPCRDLREAAAEADDVRVALGGRTDVLVDRLCGEQATVAAVVHELARGYHDVFHFAGHAFYDEDNPDRGGLVLADGNLVAADLAETAPEAALQLVVLSACESGRVRDLKPLSRRRRIPRDGRSIAEAFLRAGVRAFVGTFYTVNDASARVYASNLHRTLAAGKTLGDATRAARGALHAAGNADWGNFMLYGDDGLIL